MSEKLLVAIICIIAIIALMFWGVAVYTSIELAWAATDWLKR
jgi:hypothetical protein